MKLRFAPIALAALCALAAPAAFAQSKGSITVGLGVHNVAPKSNNGTLATGLGNLNMDIGSSARPTITGEYFIADNIGIEAIAALPFQHDIKVTNVTGVSKVGSTKHLPPTVSLLWHGGNGKLRPFFGPSVNATVFFSKKTQAPIAGARLGLSNSFGLGVHGGLDFQISEKSAIRIDARWIDIDTEVKINGTKVGTVNIDPTLYGLAYVFQL